MTKEINFLWCCYDTSSLSFEANVMKRIAGRNVSCILLTLIRMQLTPGPSYRIWCSVIKAVEWRLRSVFSLYPNKNIWHSHPCHIVLFEDQALSNKCQSWWQYESFQQKSFWSLHASWKYWICDFLAMIFDAFGRFS